MTGPDEEPAEASSRADLVDGAGWLLLGAAVLAGSVGMDRLANQDVPPFGAPGLLPGLLGLLLLLMGGVLLGRSLRRGALSGGGPLHLALPPASGRALLVVALCVAFAAGLVGHGLPFWAAAAGFVTACILLLRQGPAGERRPVDARGVGTALLIGLAAGGVITLVFQQFFLVRLP